MKYKQDIIQAFKCYKKLSPLDIKTKKELELWQEDYQLNILQYSRIVANLRDCKNINETINSDYDFDNLFIVIESLVQSGNLKIENGGEFHWNGLKKMYLKKEMTTIKFLKNLTLILINFLVLLIQEKKE